jgi:TusA-related sulfurtransferase
VNVDKIADAKGLACPMPIVKTKKAMDGIEPGEVLELEATDRGSLADIQLVDVREPAEYSFGRIRGAKSIPLGSRANC